MAGVFTEEEAVALDKAKRSGKLLQHLQTIPKDRWLDTCDHYSLIALAAYQNDIASVKYLLENGYPVDHVGPFHWPAVHIAANYGFDNLLQILLDAGGTHTPFRGSVSALEAAKGRRLISHAFFTPGAERQNHERCIQILKDHDAKYWAKIRGEK